MRTNTLLPTSHPDEDTIKWRHHLFTTAKWGAPFVNAILETAIAAMAVRDMDIEENNDSNSVSAISLLICISLFAFLQAMALSGAETVKNIDETIEITKKIFKRSENYDLYLTETFPTDQSLLTHALVITRLPLQLIQIDSVNRQQNIFGTTALQRVFSQLNLHKILKLPLQKNEIRRITTLLTRAQLDKLNYFISIKNGQALTRIFPPHWPILSTPKEMMASVISLLTTCIAAGLDFFGAYYFVSKIPEDYNFAEEINIDWWNRFSIFIGMCVLFVTIFTEGLETYKEIRHLLSHEKSHHPHLIILLIARLAYFFVITGSTEVVIEAYSAITDSHLFSITSNTTKYALLGICLQKGLSDSSFSGKRLVQAVANFLQISFELFQARQMPDKIKLTALALSAGSSILVAYPQRALTKALLTDPKTALPFTVPASLISTLSWGVTWRDGIVQTDTLYEHFNKLLQKIIIMWKRKIIEHPLQLNETEFDYHPLPGEAEHKQAPPLVHTIKVKNNIEMTPFVPASYVKKNYSKNRYLKFTYPSLIHTNIQPGSSTSQQPSRSYSTFS